MKHLKNNSYGMGGRSYEMGGKLSKQEARLLKMLMTKMMGEEGMRVMQDSGMTPSLAQRLVDEISQVGAGLRSLGNVGSFSQGYDMQEAEDRARDAKGRAGKTDATLAGLSAAIDELVDDDRAQRRLVTGATADPGFRFNRAFDRARMTTEEREEADRALRERRNR